MNLLYVTNIRMPTEKAHGLQIMKMCNALASIGWNVTLVVPDRKTQISDDPFTYYSVPRTFEIQRVPTYDVVEWGPIGFYIQRRSFFRHAAAYVKNVPADLIYSREAEGAAVAKAANLPFFWEVHQTRTGRAVREAIRYAKALFPITAGLRDFYRDQGATDQQMHIAPDAVDRYQGESDQATVRTTLGLPLDRQIVAYVGKYTTLGQSKGVEDIITSVARVVETHPKALFAIVGIETRELPLIQEQAKKVGLPEQSLHAVTHVPHATARAYMRAADVLVMNYPDTPHYRSYMSPMKLFEYMEAGKPVVSSDLPSIREVLDDNLAVLVPPGDTEAFAAGIVRVLTDNVYARSLALRAQEQAKGYTWEARAQSVEDVYLSVARQEPQLESQES